MGLRLKGPTAVQILSWPHPGSNHRPCVSSSLTTTLQANRFFPCLDGGRFFIYNFFKEEAKANLQTSLLTVLNVYGMCRFVTRATLPRKPLGYRFARSTKFQIPRDTKLLSDQKIAVWYALARLTARRGSVVTFLLNAPHPQASTIAMLWSQAQSSNQKCEYILGICLTWFNLLDHGAAVLRPHLPDVQEGVRVSIVRGPVVNEDPRAAAPAVHNNPIVQCGVQNIRRLHVLNNRQVPAPTDITLN